MSSTASQVARADAAATTSFREILVPTDLSETSLSSIAQAAEIAARFAGKLTLFHAVQFPDHAAPHWAFGAREAVLAEHERQAREQIADHAGRISVPWDVVMERDASPVEALLARMAASRPDLTVLTTHGRGGLAHLLLGSAAEEIVRRSASPVLCVRGEMPLARALSGCTVLATDFTDEASPALHAAGALAAAFGGDLLVVYTPRNRPDQPWRPYAEAERWLAGLARTLPVRVLVDTAPLCTAVLRAARAEKSGLVVVARAEAGARTAGSHAAKLMRTAPCSVLVL
jgi:nucleotide-binding universal stress UspA family protein